MNDAPLNDAAANESVWKACADVLARIERHLETAEPPFSLSRIAEELLSGVPNATETEIRINGPGKQCVIERRHVSGQNAASDRRPDHSFESIIVPGERLELRLWTDSGPRPHDDDDAISQTTEAVAKLLTGSIAKERLASVRAANQSLMEQMETEAALEGSTGQRLHRHAESLAASLNLLRVAILSRSGNRYRCVAVSAQPNLDPRAERVLLLERIANSLEQAEASGSNDQTQRISESDPTDWKLADPAQSADLQRYLAESDAKSVSTTSLGSHDLLLLGDSAGEVPAWPLGPLQPLATRAAILQTLGRNRPSLLDRIQARLRTTANRRIIAAAALLLLAMLLIPARIRVSAEGRLVPLSQQIIYAPITGQISEILCVPGKPVEKGQPLCKFSSQDLDLDIARLRGDILTVQEQLQIAATRRGEETATDVASDRRVLETRLRELSKQLELQLARERGLTVTSEIDGVVTVVLPDEVGTVTTGRPIELGQPILRVIDSEAGNRVQMEIPDRAIGYVTEALAGDEEGLPVRFRILSAPETRHRGTLTSIASEATLSPTQTLVIRGDVSPATPLSNYAAESGIAGHVTCNRAPIGFVLMRRVIEQLRLWGWL